MTLFSTRIARGSTVLLILATLQSRDAHAGAGTGALVGANVGVLVGVSSLYTGYAPLWYYTPAVYGIVGALVGAAVGSATSPSEKRAALERIEQSDGIQSRVTTGLLLGAGVGAGMGAVVNSRHGMDGGAAPLIGAGIGALAGASIAAASAGERRNTPGETEVNLQLGTPTLPVAVGVHVSFR